jgi:hypothetical protein
MTTKKKSRTKAAPDKPQKTRKQRVADARENTIRGTPAVETDATSASSPPAATNQAAETAKAAKVAYPLGRTAVAKLSALDAAAKVLGERGQAMSCPELIAAMADKGYWHSPQGRTPAATLYSALLRELQNKGTQARFVKTGRGKFALRGAV